MSDEPIYGNVAQTGEHENEAFRNSREGSEENVSRENNVTSDDIYANVQKSPPLPGPRLRSRDTSGSGNLQPNLVHHVNKQRETLFPSDYGSVYGAKRISDVITDTSERESELYEPIEDLKRTGIDADEYVTIDDEKKSSGPRVTWSHDPPAVSVQGAPPSGQYTSVVDTTDSESESHRQVARRERSGRSQRPLSARISSRVSQIWEERHKQVCGACTRCLLCIGLLVVFLIVVGLTVALFFIFALSNRPCESNPCYNGANCTESGLNFTCSCQRGYSGEFCHIDDPDCYPNPCENNAGCVDLVDDFVCLCVRGFAGDKCEQKKSKCLDDPCEHGATCVDKEDKLYFCYCAPGYTGSNCELEINECESSPCQHSSTCLDKINGYQCTCTDGYTGSNCETDINECSSNPCKNGASCVDKVNSYSCTCADGYTGTHCEIEIDECDSSPCKNGATCDDFVNRYTCTCLLGFTGTHCETNIDDCKPNPCQNGGTCIDGINAYTCNCQPGFTGKQCQTNINECASSPCRNGGTCRDGTNMYTCLCNPTTGYYGTHCEKYYCNPNPCKNGGTCSIRTNGFNCACHPDFSGATCNVDEKLKLTNLLPPTNVKKAFCSYLGNRTKDKVYTTYNSLTKVTMRYSWLYNGFTSPVNAISVSPSEVYLHALSAGLAPSLSITSYRLTSGYGLQRLSTNHNGSESVSRNVIIQTSGSYDVRLQGTTFDYYRYYMTSWCAVTLQGTMSQVVAFAAYRTGTWTSKSAITFDHVALNSGNMFRSNTFTAPMFGLYYFTFSFQIPARAAFVTELKVNGIHKVGLLRRATSGSGEDTISRTTLLPLKVGDTVQLHLTIGSVAATSLRDSSISGFLYQPEVSKQAWSVYKSASWDAKIAKCSQTLVFDKEFLDEGGLHDTRTGVVTIKVAGVYYISASLGATASRPVGADILVNSQRRGAIVRQHAWHNNADTLERSVILSLKVGDKVTVRADAFEKNTGYIWSDDSYKLTSFLGFLVY